METQDKLSRVLKLKIEIAKLREENREYLKRKSHIYWETVVHERRELRLVEILNELSTLSPKPRLP